MAEIFQYATEYRRNPLDIASGSVADINAVGIALTTDPNDIPDPGGVTDLGEFTEVTLDDTVDPPEVVTLIGPRDGDLNPDVGDWQVFILIRTDDEDIIRQPNTLTVVGDGA